MINIMFYGASGDTRLKLLQIVILRHPRYIRSFHELLEQSDAGGAIFAGSLGHGRLVGAALAVLGCWKIIS